MAASDRLAPIVDDLGRALHRVVAEHQVTEPEWRQALAFLTELGTADEWVLLSDVLGISVAVDNNTYRQQGDETPSNVQGPYYRPGAPLVSPPVSLCRDDEPGDPWLHDDTISSVKPGLVIPLAEHDRPDQLRARGLDRPFYTGVFDFVLRPAGS